MITARLCATAFLAAAFALSPPALAASPKKEAKKHYKAGKKLYKKGKYDEALKALMEANRLDPNATLAKNIAKTYEAMDNIKGAAAYLQTIIDSGRPKKAVKWAKKKLEGYSERLDEINKGEMEEAKKKAAAEAKKKAEEEAARKAEEERKQREAAEEKRKAEEEAQRKAEDEAKRKEHERLRAEAEERASTKRLVAYSAAGVGLAAVGSAVYFGSQALGARDDANTCAKAPDTCARTKYDGHVSDSESAALYADVSWIVGAAGLTTAVVFYILAAGEAAAVPEYEPADGGSEGTDEEGDEGEDDGEDDDGEGEDAVDPPEDEEGDDGAEANLMLAPGGFVLRVTF